MTRHDYDEKKPKKHDEAVQENPPVDNPKDKSNEHESHKSSHYHQHHDSTSNYKQPH